MVASRETFPLLAELLAEQQRLDTPVARFAAAHDQPGAAALAPQLIPLTQPRPGEQYAFEVDLDSCTGCKSCVAACHALNGLDDTETWRDVGLLVSPDAAQPFTQTVTTACHHCSDPACLNGCPVLAYDKDPVTGIVRHLDDQCIGCSYCILKCPYDVPKYSTRLGIVRKCDLCHGRLAAGEAPACAQSCPTHAIRIVTVPIAARIPAAPAGSASTFLPACPAPDYTQPTTRYVGQRPLPPGLVAGDAHVIQPQPPHWPLVVLLTLMPMAVGCGLADQLFHPASPALAVTGWLAGVGGLAASALHLGQPLRAWRVFLGLRRSWLSREAVVFGAWLPLATAWTAHRLGWLPFEAVAARTALAFAATAAGVVGLACSVMVYVDTRREFWRLRHTAPRFFGTALILGLAGALAAAGDPARRPMLAALLVAATLAKLVLESRALAARHESGAPFDPARHTARLLTGPLRLALQLRVGAALAGAIALPLFLAAGLAPAWFAWPALLCIALGELAERYLFFRAVSAPKMPGLAADSAPSGRVPA